MISRAWDTGCSPARTSCLQRRSTSHKHHINTDILTHNIAPSRPTATRTAEPSQVTTRRTNRTRHPPRSMMPETQDTKLFIFPTCTVQPHNHHCICMAFPAFLCFSPLSVYPPTYLSTRLRFTRRSLYRESGAFFHMYTLHVYLPLSPSLTHTCSHTHHHNLSYQTSSHSPPALYTHADGDDYKCVVLTFKTAL